jgi:hypothetical protein
MFNIVSSVGGGDLLHGIFAGNDGYAPTRLLVGYQGLNTVATTAYSLRTMDYGRLTETTNGSAVTITVRAEAEVPFPQLAVCPWLQSGAGQITFAAGDGVTIRTPETLNSAKQYAMGCLVYLGSDVWVLSGNIEAA